MEAEAFMKKRGCIHYCFLSGTAAGERAPRDDDPIYYAVANGNHVGVFECYKCASSGHLIKLF
jgi:hypothetical protein